MIMYEYYTYDTYDIWMDIYDMLCITYLLMGYMMMMDYNVMYVLIPRWMYDIYDCVLMFIELWILCDMIPHDAIYNFMI